MPDEVVKSPTGLIGLGDNPKDTTEQLGLIIGLASGLLTLATAAATIYCCISRHGVRVSGSIPILGATRDIVLTVGETSREDGDRSCLRPGQIRRLPMKNEA